MYVHGMPSGTSGRRAPSFAVDWDDGSADWDDPSFGMPEGYSRLPQFIEVEFTVAVFV
jgi:hypothetical protein